MKRYGTLALCLCLALCAGCNQPAATPAQATPAPTEQQPTPSPTPVYTPAPLPTPVVFPTKGYCNGEGVNLREAPDTKSKILDIMGENAVLDVVGLADGWYRLNMGGVTAYVSEALVNLGDPPRGDNMNYGRALLEAAPLYITPSDADLSDRTLKQGEVVKILRELTGYLHIVYDDPASGLVQRFVHKDAIEYIPITDYLSARQSLAATPTPELDSAP